MLGKRSGIDFMDDTNQSQRPTTSEAKADFVNRFMLSPENIHEKEAFILRFFVDYEYPESQEYLRTFWKNLLCRTFGRYFNSFSGNTRGHFVTVLDLGLKSLYLSQYLCLLANPRHLR